MSDVIDRNLALELARVTESAALASAAWMGKGRKEDADQAAVDAMRYFLGSVEMDGIVVIGEGAKDEAPMLYVGEQVGMGGHPKVDIAVDPIDGTRLLANGMPNALSVVALSDRGTMFTCADIAYMQKIAVGPDAADVIDIDLSPTDNLLRISRALKKRVEDLVVVILDRPRHEELIAEVRAAGSRIKLITDGDVAGAIMTAIPGTGVDVLMGIGGAPEAVVAAAALTCVGGAIQGRLWIRNEAEQAIVERDKIDIQRKFATRDLVSGRNIFFSATGITDGELLRGVHLTSTGATTQTLVMRSASGTVRKIDADHRAEKLDQLRNLRSHFANS